MLELNHNQRKAIEELKNGSILRGDVGAGKSRTALAYFYSKVLGGGISVLEGTDVCELAAPATPKDLYIITTAKKRDDLDWLKEAKDFNLSKERSVSLDGIQVTVDSWNNITNYKEVEDAFFIFDEQRLVGSGAWVKAFIKIAQRNQWILLSATPGDTWLDYIPVFVANGFYKNRTEFLQRHVVYNRFSKFPKVDHYVETGMLQRYRKRVLVEMPDARHTKRHVEHVFVDYEQELFDTALKKRWNVYKEKPIRDIAELFMVMRKIVNSDVSRIGAVMELMEKHPRLIIFYNFDYELEILRTLGNTLGIYTAEWNGHNHHDLPQGDSWLYLVQYTAGAEGWNCTTTDAMVFYSLNYSYKTNEQAKGRIDRLNTPYTDLYYYILRSTSQIDAAILKSLGAKRTFNERDFMAS